MPPIAAAAIGLAIVLDIAIREPPERYHPVAQYGRVISAIETTALPRRAASALILSSTLLAALVALALTAIVAHASSFLAMLAAGGILFTTTSFRMLLETATDVVTATETDLDDARDQLPALAGRDPTNLDGGELRSAAVESAAENLADGLVGPLLAFTVFAWSLPLAVAAAAWVKALNTADSMVGYPDHPLGTAPARLDDIVMWLPARLSAVLIALAAGEPGAIRTGRAWSRTPASPNAGWPMAAIAAVLGVRLEKPGAYAIGTGALPTPAEARHGIRLVGRAGLIAFLTAAVVAWS